MYLNTLLYHNTDYNYVNKQFESGISSSIYKPKGHKYRNGKKIKKNEKGNY